MRHEVIGPGILTDAQVRVYGPVLKGAIERGIPFALGGSLGMAVYAGAFRPSKDLDIYVRPVDKDEMIDLLGHLGSADYFDRLPYDRSWIYRSTFGDEIVDVIWKMANHRSDVDDSWVTAGPVLDFAGQHARLVPIEELIWSKLYVLQRDRCDWPDVINLIDRSAARLDWSRLRDRLGDDIALLRSVLLVYRWLRPLKAADLPSWVWSDPHRVHSRGSEITEARARLLDSRDWLLGLRNGEPRC